MAPSKSPSGNKATQPAETGVSNAERAAEAAELRDHVGSAGTPARDDDPNPPQTERRPGAQARDEAEMSVEEVIARRTPSYAGRDDFPADGRFRWVFHVEKPRTSQPKNQGAATDWADEDGSMASMHEANKVATLQWALGNGLHPTGPAELDQVIGADDEDAVTVDLVYAVDVVPASLQDPAKAADTYTPSAALGDLGGTTLAERRTLPEGHLARGVEESAGTKEMAADNDGQKATK